MVMGGKQISVAGLEDTQGGEERVTLDLPETTEAIPIFSGEPDKLNRIIQGIFEVSKI